MCLLIGALREGETAEVIAEPPELISSSLLPDILYTVRSTRGERLLHLEIQTRYQETVPERVAIYGARIWLTHPAARTPTSVKQVMRGGPEAIDSVVLLLTDRGLPDHPP